MSEKFNATADLDAWEQRIRNEIREECALINAWERRIRNETREECARVADEYAAVAKRANAPIQLVIAAERIAAFIRALKDKT